MPHLDASALERDPEGLTFLHAVLHTHPAGLRRSRTGCMAARIGKPRHIGMKAAFRIAFRLLAFAVLIRALTKSRQSASRRRFAVWLRLAGYPRGRALA
jgi:hypothetical protein